ncbi:putative cytochrome c oxidase subunit 3 [Mycobacterium xenopi 4042]|uniref:Putative cytochrome c oxidase subunit 3 n=1 Tax=Mycobacterium xenopi 4042 TaxID=1299334 RepID=X7ZY16_MYCXE|nr:putative cytochrome c oxidase subunit 3 [Mycobacterium xenopi 4042]
MVTFLMGLFFVLGQGYEYYHLSSHGTTIPAAPTAACSTWPPASTDCT